MAPPGLVVALVLVLAADPQPTAGAPALPLPRSSIAAVLAHRGELGLSDAQLKQLEARDAALQKQVDDLRQQLAGTSSRRRDGGARREGGSGASEGATPPPPTANAWPEGTGGAGGHRANGMGGRRGLGGRSAGNPRDPAARAAALQAEIDDADTAAWLSAEALLQESQRERARDIAEKYREALADEREARRAGRGAKSP
jgi:hypothetical protein